MNAMQPDDQRDKTLKSWMDVHPEKVHMYEHRTQYCPRDAFLLCQQAKGLFNKERYKPNRFDVHRVDFHSFPDRVTIWTRCFDKSRYTRGFLYFIYEYEWNQFEFIKGVAIVYPVDEKIAPLRK